MKIMPLFFYPFRSAKTYCNFRDTLDKSQGAVRRVNLLQTLALTPFFQCRKINYGFQTGLTLCCINKSKHTRTIHSKYNCC